MADLVLSPVIESLVESLAAYLGDQCNLRSGIDGKLKDLKQSLLQLQAVTRAAEEVDTNNEPLSAWLMQLKEAIYDAEDVIDEFDYRRLERRAIYAKEAKVSNLFNPRRVLAKFRTLPLQKLQNIQNRLDKLNMDSGVILQLINSQQCTRWVVAETTSFINEPNFVGRSEVLEEIINQLVEVRDGTESASGVGSEVPVVLIVGPGGFGKSTLARNVFHDYRIKNLFELRMWVHVSQNFDLKRLTKAMIESASRSGSNSNVESLERLQQDLKEAVGSRKFLLVLDDMWCGQDMLKMEENWRCLLAPLAGGSGSAILLTTRNEELKVLPGTYPPLVLNGLKDDECWSIICANTFSNGKIPDGHEHLVEIGKKIAVKLQGSPIAAKAIGGILRNNLENGYWNRILDTGMGKLHDVMDVLRLSYRHLPPHLRQCFAYCSLFHKGFWFHSNVIKNIGRMWFAQGFIRPKDGESVDEAGRRCFNDLLSRSFFQKLNNHGGYDDAYVMHDLMNDLARQVSQGDCLGFEGESLPEGKIPETVRHIGTTTKDHLIQLKIRGCDLRNLRSIIVLYADGKNDDTLKDLLKHLHRVRVLHVETRVGVLRLARDWIHLRYLYCYWKEPQSFYRLYHLQVLAINRNTDIVRRNSERKVSNLPNLRVLDFNGGADGFQDISFVGRLTNLEELTYPFHVTRNSGCDIRQLKTLDKLSARLHIRNLENIESKEQAEAANLQGKRSLESLFLTWGHDFTSRAIPSLPKDVEVFEALRPHSNLNELMIRGYGGSVCPSWMHNNWLSNLSTLSLQSLGMLVQLPRLGELPLLETLRLQSLSSVRKIGGHDFYGEKAISFPSLKELVIEDMAMLEEWSRPERDGLCSPNLQVLRIRNCPKLSSFPWATCLQDSKVYGGSECPSWMHNNWLSNLSTISLQSLGMLVQLPRLGELPLLETLRLQSLSSVRKIGGYDFYGEKATSFPSLKELVIEDMAMLEEWFRPERDGLCSPNLQVLRIQKCPKLSSLHWATCSQDSKLETLHLQSLSSVRKIGGHDFYGEKATFFPSLKELVIEDMAILEEWSRPEGDGLCSLNLEVLRIQKCPQLSSLPWVIGLQEDGSLPPSSLKILDIYECHVLVCDIFCSPCLQGFPNLSNLRVHKHISLLQTGLMGALVKLIILDCEALTPMGLVSVLSLATLKRLAIRGCAGLVSETSSPTPTYLPGANFSSSLETLVIDELLLLTTAPILKAVSCLRELSVTGSFEGAYFPPEVQDLLCQNCCTLSALTLCSTPFLRSLPAKLDCMSALKTLFIYDAPDLQSLPVLPQSLRNLTIGHVNAGFRSRYQKGGPDCIGCGFMIWHQKEVALDWLKVQHIAHFGIFDAVSGEDPYKLGGSTILSCSDMDSHKLNAASTANLFPCLS